MNHQTLSGARLDLESIVDTNKLGSFHIRIIALCALLAMMDGFDTQAIAFVAPEIADEWHVDASSFGVIFGLGLFGGLLGAMLLGMAGDRFGRKPMLVFATLAFAIGSLLTPLAGSLVELAAARFGTGLGLGGALPGVIALTAEYAPKRLRTSVVGWMFCGFPLGAVLGGIAAARLIPAFGWSSVFIAGGLLPLLVLPLVMLFVPESIRFLATRGSREPIDKVLQQMGRSGDWNGASGFVSKEEHAPVASLFKHGRGRGTLLLWATLFLSLLMTYFLVNWIPVVARQGGLPITTAVLALSMLNLGAIIGCIVIGRLADRSRPAIPIGVAFAFGGVAIACISQAGASGPLLCLATFLVGALSIGAQMCTVALCAGYYDTFLRATGVGWAMGIGRIGAIAGPVLGGLLLGAGLPASSLFLWVGLVSVAAAAAIFIFGSRSAESLSGSSPRVTEIAAIP